jgi:hypothetical protein
MGVCPWIFSTVKLRKVPKYDITYYNVAYLADPHLNTSPAINVSSYIYILFICRRRVQEVCKIQKLTNSKLEN